MPILIPSKNMYDNQNPKIIDNSIERIEVNAIEILPNNKYETPVYNEKIITQGTENYAITNTNVSLMDYWINSWTYSYGIGVAKTQITRIYHSGTIKIPKLEKNTLINEIFSKLDKDGNPRIKYVARCTKKTGTVTAEETLTTKVSNSDSQYIEVVASISNSYILTHKRVFLNEVQGENLIEQSSISFSKEFSVNNKKYSVTANTTYEDNRTNIGDLDIKYDEESDEYYFSYTVLCGIIFDKLGAETDGTIDIGGWEDGEYTSPITLVGQTEFYAPEQIEFTLYGNTLSIDLENNIMYIPEGDKTSKKVYKVEGNELLQTTNYYQTTGINSIENQFQKTLDKYSKGKETATILCDVNDYYENGTTKKIIAIDNSTGKMSFQEYDEVIPMVYGSDGKDHPMSYYQDGTPKVFKVLGTSKFYDGAVWQKLSLQEI